MAVVANQHLGKVKEYCWVLDHMVADLGSYLSLEALEGDNPCIGSSRSHSVDKNSAEPCHSLALS